MYLRIGMNRIETYKTILPGIKDRIRYIKENSNLPGPRGNLELLQAIAEIGDESFFMECLTYDEHTTPSNTPGEFVACCGITGLGRIIAEGKDEYFETLKAYASDSRWRVREGVAFALQIVGKKDFSILVHPMEAWKKENLYVQRAIVAGLCEPALLKEKENTAWVLDLLYTITAGIQRLTDRKDESLRVLKKGLGYGLSVAIAACPEKGKLIFEKLLQYEDRDIRWILRENLKKNRLIRTDPVWVERMNEELRIKN